MGQRFVVASNCLMVMVVLAVHFVNYAIVAVDPTTVFVNHVLMAEMYLVSIHLNEQIKEMQLVAVCYILVKFKRKNI